MLRTWQQRAPPPEALARVEAWCRDRFALAEKDVLLVSEVNCTVPGCPPLETVVAFWTAPDARHLFKVFKKVADVEPSDLPYSWQRPTLLTDALESVDCC